jgi:hypothetical protein
MPGSVQTKSGWASRLELNALAAAEIEDGW